MAGNDRVWPGIRDWRPQQGGGSESETQPPLDLMDDFDINFADFPPVPDSQPQFPPVTLDQVLRGPSRQYLKKLVPEPDEDPEKKEIWFKLHKEITHTITKIMQADFDGSRNWGTVEDDKKDRWFKAFAQKFNWDYEITQLVRENFDAVGVKRLNDCIHYLKTKWLKGKRSKS
ncbi:hypothetical protein V5N11_019495 [Cardamine amara subsp. amara]|uniref:Uncharacterized protein n=1 Tax=Cardamine amara subsp. amara TaxID=228776 RepID=A0ABD1C0U4_CARAN